MYLQDRSRQPSRGQQKARGGQHGSRGQHQGSRGQQTSQRHGEEGGQHGSHSQQGFQGRRGRGQQASQRQAEGGGQHGSHSQQGFQGRRGRGQEYGGRGSSSSPVPTASQPRGGQIAWGPRRDLTAGQHITAGPPSASTEPPPKPDFQRQGGGDEQHGSHNQQGFPGRRGRGQEYGGRGSSSSSVSTLRQPNVPQSAWGPPTLATSNEGVTPGPPPIASQFVSGGPAAEAAGAGKQFVQPLSDRLEETSISSSKGSGQRKARKKPTKDATRTTNVECANTSTQQPSVPLSGDTTPQDVANYHIPRLENRLVKHDPAKVIRSTKIEVNYLKINVRQWDVNIFHYDVSFKPEKPSRLFRPAIDILRRKYFPNRHPVFDGKKNLYAGRELLPHGREITETVTVRDPEENRDKEMTITIQPTARAGGLNLNELRQYMRDGSSTNVPQAVIQAVDIAFRESLFQVGIPVGRSFICERANHDLGGGMELWRGIFQSTLPTWDLYLNVDVANKAFSKQQPVIEYLRSLNSWNDDELRNGLSRDHQAILHSYIKSLKIRYCIAGHEHLTREYRVNGLGVSAHDHKFPYLANPQSGQETIISVYDYFTKNKGIPIRYPKLPLLHVGPNQKNIMVPMEFCEILSTPVMRKLEGMQTANMIRGAVSSTNDRKRRIMDNIRRTNYGRDGSLEEFGLSVDNKFLQVDSVTLKPPSIEYRNRKETVPRDGVWDLRGNEFLDSPGNGLNCWAILILDFRTREQDAHEKVGGLFVSCGRQLGLAVKPPITIVKDKSRECGREDAIKGNLLKLKSQYQQLQLVIVIFDGRSETYNSIKRASELKTGILTQCIKGETVFKRMNPMTANNLLLKINAKINGANHTLGSTLRPKVLNEKVMFVGADVTHPSPGSGGALSIAAVAASFDHSGFRYRMKYKLQNPREEMIRDLADIMIDHLEHYVKVNKSLPGLIMYYRDGVSDGQFYEVLKIELTAIKRACSFITKGCSIKVTFLVVQKRHHTRFFPINPNDGDRSKNNNVLPGTVVDSQITHPKELDFYLVSHKSIQGTARPTKYHLLYDDHRFAAEDLEILTYYLCYMFSRCTRSVSYPAPTYYAHLGAERGRAYWDGQRCDLLKLKEEQEHKGMIHSLIPEMFFV